MILDVYITDFMCQAAIVPIETVQSVMAACPQLLRAKWQVRAHGPLHTLFNRLHEGENLSATSSLVSAMLFANSSVSMPGTFLCLLPVHLNLQRDSFSLQGTVPLSTALYLQLTEQIRQHFASDFILHTDPDGRFWWIQPLTALEVECPWPQSFLFQQAFAWQPVGKDARVLRQWANECQMLMHQAAALGEPSWPVTLNSLWFCNIPALPRWQHAFDAVSGHGRVFEGLSATGLPAVHSQTLEALLQTRHYGKALWVADSMDGVDWQCLADALSQGALSTLNLILPFAERTVKITLKRSQRWCFWRKQPSIDDLLQQLHAALLSQTSVIQEKK